MANWKLLFLFSKDGEWKWLSGMWAFALQTHKARGGGSYAFSLLSDAEFSGIKSHRNTSVCYLLHALPAHWKTNISDKDFPRFHSSQLQVWICAVANCGCLSCFIFFAGVPWAPAVVKQGSGGWNKLCHQILCLSTTFPHSSNALDPLVVESSWYGGSGVGGAALWNAEARGRLKMVWWDRGDFLPNATGFF